MGTMGSLPEDSQQNAGNTANLTEVSFTSYIIFAKLTLLLKNFGLIVFYPKENL